MKREADLIDVWFDSGAMPYAQLHYPFENKELWTTVLIILRISLQKGWIRPVAGSLRYMLSLRWYSTVWLQERNL